MRARICLTLLLSLAAPLAARAAVVERSFMPAAGRMQEGEPTLAPFAHVVFCMKTPGECRADGRPNAEQTLDEAAWQALRRVNSEVNKAIRPVADRPGPLGDVWSLSPRTGDCEDYAITKRHRLLALGWAPAALRMVVARTRAGEGHAVLLVKTDQGDYVLDNRTPQIVRWNETKLVFLKVQSGADPQRWMDVSVASAMSENR